MKSHTLSLLLPVWLIFLLASPLTAQKTRFSPFQLEARYFDDPKVKDGMTFVEEGITYRVINNAFNRGLKIIDSKKTERWHGVVFTYSGGKLTHKAIYQNGVLDGPYEFYYSKNGNVFIKRQYVNGLREGMEYEFYTEGGIKSEAPYANDLLHGEKKYYHAPEKGQLQGPISITVPYEHGKAVGEAVQYDRSGKVVARWKNK